MGQENVYGSQKRLEWIADHIRAGDTVLEFGCGTGCMISLPLALRGVDIVGVDLDERSIEYGHEVLTSIGLSPSLLSAEDLSRGTGLFDVIIASEVLEHIETEDLPAVLDGLRRRLRPGGRLLITVPNGYGWFEVEQFLWRAGAARLVSVLRVDRLMNAIRHRLIGHDADDPYPNTLADDTSPHVQRFTRTSLRRLLNRNGWEVGSVSGSVMFSGPITNTVFRGFRPFLALNCWLGDRFPQIASGFYLVAWRPAGRDEHPDELAGPGGGFE